MTIKTEWGYPGFSQRAAPCATQNAVYGHPSAAIAKGIAASLRLNDKLVPSKNTQETLMKNFVFLVTVLALSSLSLAGTPSAIKANSQQEAAASAQKTAAQAVPHSPDVTSSCSFTFTSGSNNTFLRYCVTVNGNIPQLETPAGQEMIAVGAHDEGYGVCNETPATAYYDYADGGDSGNWGAPVTTQPNATTVKVVRSTSDGIWTLTQTITQDKSTPSVKISMALKNNTAISRRAYLVRYADVDAGNFGNNNFDGTANSAFGWSSTTGVGDGVGLTLKNVGPRWSYVNGFGQSIFNPPNPCAFAFNWPGTIVTGVDGSMVLAYVDTIGAGQTKTATMVYRGM